MKKIQIWKIIKKMIKLLSGKHEDPAKASLKINGGNRKFSPTLQSDEISFYCSKAKNKQSLKRKQTRTGFRQTITGEVYMPPERGHDDQNFILNDAKKGLSSAQEDK